MKRLLTIFAIALLFLQMSSVEAWEIERPSDDVDIYEREESADTNGEASVGLGVSIDEYEEHHPDYGKDVIYLNVSMTTNSRMGIQYADSWESLWWIDDSELGYRNVMVGVGDDWGSWIDFPAEFGRFRFYGGPGSAEYERVYVCSNGFIGFDSEWTSPIPSNIPNPANPNVIIAAVWTDLNIDSSASIITGLYEFAMRRYFVITWKNALHSASGVRLTFQIILRDDSDWYSQSLIYISYKSVSAINTDFAVGIEDQEGYKGLGGLADGTTLQYYNGDTRRFYQSSNTFFLKHLAIAFQDANPDTEFNILKETECIRGHNVKLRSGAEPDNSTWYEKALAGWIVLLFSKASVLIGPLLATAKTLAYYQYSHAEWLELKDQHDIEGVTEKIDQGAYIKAPAYYSVVDATLSVRVHWILDTPNDSGSHFLTITANSTYEVYDTDGAYLETKSLPTSVNLKINPDDNNSFEDARVVSAYTYYDWVFLGGMDEEDYYKVWVDADHSVSVTLYPPSDAAFFLYLYSHDDWNTPKDSSEIDIPGERQQASFYADSDGYAYIKMTKRHPDSSERGFYRFYVSITEGGGNGCPWLSTWDRSSWQVDNNLIPAAEYSGGTDVIDHYLLQQPLNRDQGRYSLFIWDSDKHSFLDRVQLVAVDHVADVNVAASPGGEILTYREPTPTARAFNRAGEDILGLLWESDGQSYQGQAGDYVLLDFEDRDIQDGAKLVVRSDVPCEPWCYKSPIYIQTLNSSGAWQTISTIYTRRYWATDIIDLSEHLPDANGGLKVRLAFTSTDKIDFIGLDTSEQAEFQTRYANLASALHSNGTVMKDALKYSDNIYLELFPGEAVRLDFTLPQGKEEQRDFILITKGHYFPIN